LAAPGGEGDSPALPKLSLVGHRFLVVLGCHSEREVTRSDYVDTNAKISAGVLGSQLVEREIGRSLAGVVVELAALGLRKGMNEK
jgi:hypothetical protein